MKRMYGAFFAVVVGVSGATPAQADAIGAGNLSREIEKTRPSIESKAPSPPLPEESPPAKEEKRSGPLGDQAKGMPSEKSLAFPIETVTVTSPIMEAEIRKVLSNKSLEGRIIDARGLMEIKQQVWDLGLKSKRLLSVFFRVDPSPSKSPKIRLSVNVAEIVVRNVRIEAEGPVRETLLQSIQTAAAQEFFVGKRLNLDELEDSIKARLRLGDVLLHASLVPVDPTQVDLKLTVKSAPPGTPSALLQYDNSGGWSFGRDRLVGGAVFYGLFPGDQLDLLAMKTADVGNGDYADGMYFGRAEYQVPIGEWGVKFNTWASGLHYHEVKKVLTMTQTNGEALEMGQGVTKPIYVGSSAVLDLHADVLARYSVDRIWETDRTAEKAEYAGRLKIMYAEALAGRQSVQLSATLTEGAIDLTGHRGAWEQDQAGPKANGVFTKFEGEGSWFGVVPSQEKADFRLALKGQWASKNLDSIEQFSLGGSSGLRAFGSGEASGDMGVMVNGEIGYAFDQGIRPFALYDIGAIWKSVTPWAGEGGTGTYILQDVGVGLSASFDPVELKVTYAHQVGPNPGHSSTGLDVDNSEQHYRVWASLLYRY